MVPRPHAVIYLQSALHWEFRACTTVQLNTNTSPDAWRLRRRLLKQATVNDEHRGPRQVFRHHHINTKLKPILLTLPWMVYKDLAAKPYMPPACPPTKCSNAPNGGGSKALGAMACNTPHPDLCHQSLSLGARGRSSTDWSVMGYLLSGFEELSSKVLAIGSSRRACNRGGTPRKGLSKSIDSVIWWWRHPTSLTSKFADHWKSTIKCLRHQSFNTPGPAMNM